MIVKDFIKSSLRKLGTYSSNEDPTPKELQDGMTQLNRMLNHWAIMPNGLYTFITESFNLNTSQTYTYGLGGDFDSPRPIKIMEAFTRSGTIDRYMIQANPTNWAQITLKSLSTYPNFFLYKPDYPLASVSFYPKPSSVNEVFFYAKKALGQYSDLSDELNLPIEYEEAIVWNLAEDLASEYYSDVPVNVEKKANKTLKDLLKYHAQNVMPPFVRGYRPERDNRRRFNIYRGY